MLFTMIMEFRKTNTCVEKMYFYWGDESQRVPLDEDQRMDEWEKKLIENEPIN